MEFKNDRKLLYEVMEKYAETGDSSLITEEVYMQYVKFIQYISIKYALYDKLDIDDKVSIVNQYMWKRIKQFDRSRGSIGTFLSVVIKTSFLMDMRVNKSMKNSSNKFALSLDAVMKINDSYDSCLRREDREGNIDDEIIEFEYMDLFHKALDDYANKKSKENMRIKIKTIVSMYFNEYDQVYISKVLNHSQSYISRIINGFYKYVNENKELYLG